MEKIDFLIKGDQYLKHVSVDNILLGYHDRELKVLLQRPQGLDKWTVTGGYVKKTESIEEAASRVTYDRTGLKGMFFQQFRSFGNPRRAVDPEFNASYLNKVTGIAIPDDLWIFDYFISIGFYTLTEFSLVKPQKGEFDAECFWWPIKELPRMMFDHEEQIREAVQSLRIHIAHYPIGYELLPKKFTLPEIHNLYETILGKNLDDRNFTKKLLVTGIIIKLDERKKIGPHRSPYLYQFDKKRYDEKLKTGVDLAF
jgi:ADP-ribose pyrophosphatase YjhB (NUDIX family)